MNNLIRNVSLFLTLGLATTAMAPSAFSQEPAQQPAAQDAALESLRAGAVNDSGLMLVSTERAGLVAASAPVLETLRAADLDFSDHELQVILVTVAVVLLIVILV